MALAPGASVHGAVAPAGGPGLVLVVDASGSDPGTPIPISAAQLQSITDSSERIRETVTVYDTDGSSRTSVYQGASMTQLLALGNLSAAGVESMALARGPGDRRGPLQLTKAEITSGFAGDSRCGPNCQAVILPSNGGELFQRPARSMGDPNGADDINYQQDTPMRIDVTTMGGKRFTPDLLLSPHDDPGLVRLTATGAPGGSTYGWTFGTDGCPPQPKTSSSELSCTYPAGTFTATVQIVGPDGQSTGAKSLTFTVGHPGDGGTATTPATPTGEAGGGSGGNGTGGGTATAGGGSGGAKAPNTGPATSTGNGSSAPEATTPATGAGRTQGGSTSRRSGTAIPRHSDGKPGAAANSTTSRTSAAGSTSAGHGSTATTHTARAATTTATPAARATPPAPAPTPPSAEATTPVPANGRATPPGGATRPVSGKAVAGRGPNVAAALVAAEALAAAPPRLPSPQAAARAAAGHGTKVLAGVTGGAVIIGLLGLGAAREMRRLPKRLTPA